MRSLCSSTFALAALLAVGIAHGAADPVPPALRACAKVKESSERLICYDQTIERLSSPELTSLSAHVAALSRDAAGALVINLDNGQQWLQTSGTSSPLLEVGHEVTITRAALNSFRLTTPSGRVLKVRRVL